MVVQEYRDIIFSMIMRQVGDRTTSEELTQETFVKAYVNLKRFRGESKLGTWMTRIALNETNNYFASRRFKEARRSESFSAETHDQVKDGDEQQEMLEKERWLVRFRAALATLRPLFREVLVLCSLEGRSYEEAAQVLDIPVGTVRSRLNKARLLMREALLQGEPA